MAHQLTAEGGANLSPTALGQTTAEGGANLAPSAGHVFLAEGGANLSPTALGQTTAEGGASLTPTAPVQFAAESSGNLAPTALGQTTAEGGANLSPTTPLQLGAEGGANLSPTTPVQLAAEGGTNPAATGYAALTTALTGTHNDLVYTAKAAGPTGDAISVGYSSPAAAAVTAAAASGSAITVTPAAKARMLVSGVGGGYDGYYNYSTVINGYPAWLQAGAEYPGELKRSGNGTRWEIEEGADVKAHSATEGENPSAFPDLASAWYLPAFGENPATLITPFPITPAVSTAAAVKAAVDGTPATAALVAVANAPANDGTGAVAAMDRAYLTGGNNPALPLQITPEGGPA